MIRPVQSCGRILFFVLICFSASAPFARSQPTMSVSFSKTYANFNHLHPGDELQIIYVISNTSPAGDIYDMIKFTLPSGFNEGIYTAIRGLDFGSGTAVLTDETLYFDGDATPMVSGGTGEITLYSTNLQTRLAYATAEARGDANGTFQFTPVLVEVLALPPPPPAMATFSMASNTVTLTAANLAWGHSYTLRLSPNLATWTNLLTLWATNATQSIPLPGPTNGVTQFYRLSSP
jgi:hypothetical protein